MHNLTAFNCLPPLALVVQSESGSAASHLWSLGCWAYPQPNQRHSSILMQLEKLDPICGMENDVNRQQFNSEPKFGVIMLTREAKTRGPKSPLAVKGPIWYTDGSKTWSGTGAGLYRQSLGTGLIISLGRYAAVFQAELYTILACVYKIHINIKSQKYISICCTVKQL